MKKTVLFQCLAIVLVLCVVSGQAGVRAGVLADNIIADVNPGSNGSFPTNLYVYKSSLYFSAYTVTNGRELWTYDGTNAYLLADINGTTTYTNGVFIGNDSAPYGFITYSNAMYFTAFEPVHGGELWRYDGTNTTRVTDISPDSGTTTNSNPNSSWPEGFNVMGTELFFSANSGTSKPNYELWKYNGITASQIANIHPDSGSDYSSYPLGMTVFNGALYFMADDGTHGYELWKASSTNAVLLADINPGNEGSSSYPKYFTPFKNKLYFQAYNSTTGYELWQTDGTNTSIVADLNPSANSSDPKNFCVYRNALYFQATDGVNGYELWKYDGAILSLVSNINLTGDSFPKNLTVFSNQLFFAATDGIHGYELWKYDGTNASMVVDLNPSGDSFPEQFTIMGNALYFVANTPDTGYEWWKCDGNTVTLAADINPGSGSSYPQAPAVYNGTLCFSATSDGVSNWEPWSMWFTPLQITSLQPLAGNFLLSWTTAAGKTNIVQSSPTVNGPFSNLSAPIVIPGYGTTNATYLDTSGMPQNFYRVVSP